MQKKPKGLSRWVCMSVLGAAALMAGCQSTGMLHLSSDELEPFQPLLPSQRIMNQVKLRWEIRQDVAAYCARAYQMGQEQAYLTPPQACAIWHVGRQECTIVTGPQTSHLALGHEVRHCFEGQFHR